MDEKSQVAAMQLIGSCVISMNVMLLKLGAMPGIDKRSLAVARTQLETGLLWLSSAVSGGAILEG